MLTHIMQSKELSMQEQLTIVRLQKQNIHQRDSRNIRSGQINCLVLRRRKKCTSELSNIKRPGCPQRITVVDDPLHGKENPTISTRRSMQFTC